MVALSEKQLFDLSDEAYKVDPGHEKYASGPKLGADLDVGAGSSAVKCRVVEVAHRSENGFEAITVVPINPDGSEDWENVTVVYAGTKSTDPDDVGTDVVAFGMGDRDGQGQDALDMAHRAEAKAKEHGASGRVKTSGHSLGGGLALYVAIRMGLSSETFCAADPWLMLTEAERRYALTHPDERIDNRVLNDGITGRSNLLTTGSHNRSAAIRWVGGDGHSLDKILFNGDGTIVRDQVSPEELKRRMLADAALIAGIGGLVPLLFSPYMVGSSSRVALDDSKRQKISSNLDAAMDAAVGARRVNDRVPEQMEEAFNEVRALAGSLLGVVMNQSVIDAAIVRARLRPEHHYDPDAIAQSSVDASSFMRECQELKDRINQVMDGIVATDSQAAYNFVMGN